MTSHDLPEVSSIPYRRKLFQKLTETSRKLSDKKTNADSIIKIDSLFHAEDMMDDNITSTIITLSDSRKSITIL